MVNQQLAAVAKSAERPQSMLHVGLAPRAFSLRCCGCCPNASRRVRFAAISLSQVAHASKPRHQPTTTSLSFSEGCCKKVPWGLFIPSKVPCYRLARTVTSGYVCGFNFDIRYLCHAAVPSGPQRSPAIPSVPGAVPHGIDSTIADTRLESPVFPSLPPPAVCKRFSIQQNDFSIARAQGGTRNTPPPAVFPFACTCCDSHALLFTHIPHIETPVPSINRSGGKEESL